MLKTPATPGENDRRILREFHPAAHVRLMRRALLAVLVAVTLSACSSVLLHYQPVGGASAVLEPMPGPGSCTPAIAGARLSAGSGAALRLQYDPNPPFAFRLSLYILRGHQVWFETMSVTLSSPEWSQPVSRPLNPVVVARHIASPRPRAVPEVLAPSDVFVGDLASLDVPADNSSTGVFKTGVNLKGAQPFVLTVQLPALMVDGTRVPSTPLSFTAVKTQLM